MDLLIFIVLIASFIAALMTFTSRMLGPGYSILKRISNGDGAIEAAYAMLAPVFYQCLLIVLFDASGAWSGDVDKMQYLYRNSWWAVLLYRAVVLLYSVIVERNGSLFYQLFIVRTAISCGLSSYFSYNVLAVDVANLIPSSEDVVFQFWMMASIVVLAFVSTRNDKDGDRIDYESLFYEVDRLARDKYPKRFQQDHVLRALYCSFGMIEAHYRPKAMRAIERLLFALPGVKTTGIMQVKAESALSDEESIERAFPIVEKIWNDFLLTKSKYAASGDQTDLDCLGLRDGIDGELLPFEIQPHGYTYQLEQMKRFARANYSGLHLRYMGTSKFPGGCIFFDNALECINQQLYQPGNTTVTVEANIVQDEEKSL